MRYLKKLIIVISLLTGVADHAVAQRQINKKSLLDSLAVKGTKSKWKLVFSDHFSKKGSFDTTKWSYSQRQNPAWARYLTAHKDFVQVNGKRLVLKMDTASLKGDSVEFHSGGIQTLGKFSLKYGVIEVRARFTEGKGSWPAIWMMPAHPVSYGTWPNSGEIDIMEHVNNEKVVHQTVHNKAVTNAKGASTGTSSNAYRIGKFNNYGIHWTADYIQFFINGKLQYTYHKKGNNFEQWPFDKPFYIILNQSGGAGWPGKADKKDMPFTMEVDWVKAYQQQVN